MAIASPGDAGPAYVPVSYMVVKIKATAATRSATLLGAGVRSLKSAPSHVGSVCASSATQTARLTCGVGRGPVSRVNRPFIPARSCSH